MPRVTRRSVASKEETSSQEESPTTKATARRGRGAKREEPEDVNVDEPQEVPAKRGRSSARGVKVQDEPKAGRGRGRGRGGRATASRGKKAVEEENEEEEEDEEVEEEKTDVKPTRGKGRGRGRQSRGRKAADEDESESIEEESKSSASASRGGRRGRGRPSAQKDEEPSSEQGAGDGESAENSSQDSEQPAADSSQDTEQSDVSSGGRGRRRAANNKPAESPSTGRRSRSKNTEAVTPPPAKGGRRRRGAAAEVEETKEEEEPSEPMETEKADEVAIDTTAEEKEKPEEDKEAEAPSVKKRKIEEEEVEEKAEVPTAKRARTTDDNESNEQAKETDELADFVVVQKNDVPAPDSKEVTESIACATPVDKSEEPVATEKEEKSVAAEEIAPPSQDENASTEEEPEKATMPAPNLPIVVPLTEAEITKQYTSLQIEKERDENSSTLVEVGSEPASDITGVSTRGLDMSDVTSMDSIDQQTDMPTNQADLSANAVDQTDTEQQQVGEANSVDTADPVEVSCEAAKETPTVLSTNNSEAAPPTATAESPVQVESAVPTNTPSQAAPILQNATVNSVVPPPETKQNGNIQEPLKSVPLLASTPAKVVVPSEEKPAPSSTSIFQRKFLPNPNFPAELMDPAFCFSVVTYNILADCHLRRYDYSFTEDQYLEQSYRHNLMMKELDYLSGDIVCMQEVNPAYYHNMLHPAMISRGYTGNFIKRTAEFYDEGEATFVKSSKFDILTTQGISLKELSHKEVELAGLNEEVKAAAKRYLDRADVILLSKLACKKTGKQMTLCNIHVVYDPASPDVQCIQVASAIKELVSKAGNDLSPHIICGDFNCDTISPGYQLAKDGYLSDAHIRNLQATQRLDNADGSSRSMIHHMWRAFQHTSSNLKSAYETTGREPLLTSYNAVTNKALDYLFFSSSSLDVAGVLETVDRNIVLATGGTPNKDIPSDHLSLKAVFRIK